MKSSNAKFIIISLAILVLYACASDSYTYYGVNVSQVDREELAKGKLLHKDPKKDLDMTACLPNAKNKSPCIALFSTEYFKILRDLEEMKARLQACEKGN